MAERRAEIDLLVVGSGGGGLAAALAAHDAGLSVLVVEKGKRFGGSTAISGGGIWIPNNPTLERAGAGDDPESVLRYLHEITAGRVPAARLRAFVDNGPRLMALLDRSRWVRFFWVKGYADYHPELEGGRALGRTIEAVPFDTRKLGEDERHQRPNSLKGPLGLWVTSKDYHDLAMVKRTWAGRRASLRAAWRVASNAVRRRHMATGGRALVARLRMALKDAQVPVWLRSPMRELVVEDGRVAGAVIERDGEFVRVFARRGVLLATGGFEHDPLLRERYLPEGAQADASAGAQENVGDGIRAGLALGAAVDLMDDAWWMPSVEAAGAGILILAERSLPRCIVVNGEGRRFVNEASPYVNFVHRMYELNEPGSSHIPSFLIFDQTYRDRYPFVAVPPRRPLPKAFTKFGIVTTGDSLSDLAEKIGVPPANLAETVARFNTMAAGGKDEDFAKGDSAYDRYYGDPANKPNPCLGPLEKPPFYAFRIVPGDLGTKGGVVTDPDARVLDGEGKPIPGLYATGNNSASVMGNDYAGAGATIGPAIVFGYVAAKHIAANPS